MHRSRMEILVGLFVILALVILSFMVFFVSGVYVFKQGYHIDVVFNFVSRLEKGSAVRLAGIPIGNVTSLGIEYNPETGKPLVKTHLFINQGVQLREDAKIRIEGVNGLMTPYLEIRAGGNPDARVLTEGDTVIGIDPIALDDLVAKGQAIVENLQETITRINNFSRDPEIAASVRGSLINLNALTSNLNEMLVSHQGNVSKTIHELETATQHLKNVLQRLDQGEGTAGKLLSDDALYREHEEFVRDLKQHPWRLLK
ncbi:MAG: MCE family protein, partial [Candidatus Omnitrophica bacterium]|nr:MCE family protein [Candidatus Omnitrophota bacterium]